MRSRGYVLKKWQVSDEATFAFFRALSEKLGVAVAMRDELPELEDVREDLLDMDPNPVMDEFDSLLDLLEGEQSQAKAKGRKKTANESYVISVSLGRGCYRHIRISGKCSLWDLHCAIIDAFEFDDDHAHAFFMDNVKWSDRDSYYTEAIGEGRPTTEKTRIGSVGLYKGMAFKYVFDFGDEWVFQCKVLKVETGDSGEAVVIKSKGEAPSQYGDADDEWDDE